MFKQLTPTTQAAPPAHLVTKQVFGSAISSSTRTVDRLIAAKLIPVIKLPTAPGRDGKLHGRCLIPFADAMTALSKFRVNAIGESVTGTPHRKRPAGRITEAGMGA